MTYRQFWYGDPHMARAYAQAYLLKRKIENENAWIQGAYIASAFGTVLSNAFGKKNVKYLEQPMDLFPKTEAEKKEEIRKERMKVVQWLMGVASAFNRKHNGTGSDKNGKP